MKYKVWALDKPADIRIVKATDAYDAAMHSNLFGIYPTLLVVEGPTKLPPPRLFAVVKEHVPKIKVRYLGEYQFGAHEPKTSDEEPRSLNKD